MTIKDTKQRFVIVIEKETLEKIKELAKKEKRSTSNMATIILEKYIEENQ